MDDPIVSRRNFEFAALSLLGLILPPMVVVAMLFAMTRLFNEIFGIYMVAASAVSFGLSAVLLQPPRNMANTAFTQGIPIVFSIFYALDRGFALLLAIGFTTKYSGYFPRRVILSWAAVTPVLLVVVTLILNEARRRILNDPSNARRVVFAGYNDLSLNLADRLANNPEACMKVTGFFDDRSLERLGLSNPGQLLGNLQELANHVRANDVKVIFVALPVRHIQRVMQLLDDLRDSTASIYYVPDLPAFDLIQSRTGEILGMPVVAMCETPFIGHRAAMKRLIDVVVAISAAVALSPLLLAIAYLVKQSSPGPVIFKQRRYGLDGREIYVYKFRTMTVTEDGKHIRQATKNDVRITRFGAFLRRYSLDEMPQLINILQGSMSLVGPRPHAVAHNEQYRKLIKGYMLRHKVLPGITGLAQINGCRGETARLEEMEARIRFDLDYVRRWSLWLDVKILLLTLSRVIRDDKAL